MAAKSRNRRRQASISVSTFTLLQRLFKVQGSITAGLVLPSLLHKNYLPDLSESVIPNASIGDLATAYWIASAGLMPVSAVAGERREGGHVGSPYGVGGHFPSTCFRYSSGVSISMFTPFSSLTISSVSSRWAWTTVLAP